MSIQHAWSRGYRKVIFEGNNQTVHKLLMGEQLNFQLNKFSDATTHWIPRIGNHAADRLVKENFPNNCNFKFHFYVPAYLLQSDHIHN
ncbi:hypothetical protein CARUB_v10003250mg [Capsella rubella]|uniref:RNase H type-1 domain-containing protein n=1 Tax=Capsella rubella TaxID=81985 RepID=R0HFQ1_9BRAS|nr:hypothetical protein CARUB_v10003250mg [Capsella rubella]